MPFTRGGWIEWTICSVGWWSFLIGWLILEAIRPGEQNSLAEYFVGTVTGVVATVIAYLKWRWR